MNRKKLNCTRDKWRQRLPGIGSLLALLLVALMLAAPAMAAGDQGEIPLTPLANKPEVTIQGNVVVDDNGAPTGFYELALCVRSPRRIYGPDPAAGYATSKELSEAEYAQVLAAIEAGTLPAGVDENSYTVTYYPFSAASAVVGVNADVLTAVNWDVENVTYSEWNGTNYVANDTDYPRGIDLTPTTGGNFDPDVWDVTDPAPFPDVTKATLQKPNPLPVALDAEGDRSAFTAAAQVDHYYENPANNTKAALVTLSAHAPDNKPVIFKTSTPVAVVRFSYDLKRFPKNVVMVNEAFNNNDAHVADQITGSDSAGQAAGFWLGLDQAKAYLRADGKMPLTWLADTAMGTGGDSFDFSDAKAAATEAGQVVWTKLSSQDTAAEWVDWQQTEYYYYLGAKASGSNGAPGTVKVSTNAGIQEVANVHIPDTKGAKILAPGTAENPQPGGGDYSYYTNLLYLDGARDLRLKLVNATTFRAPRGGKGGTQILFYDWDDTLIGTLIVGKGDVRKDVNNYVEKNLVHPDLRSNSPFMADESGSGGMSQEEKYSSLDREYTYRGKYAYTVGGDATQAVPDGKEYPLTNKLDYVFTKRVNTYLTQEESGSTVRYVHPYALSDPELDPVLDGADLYPWAYGWAVVEDTRAFNGRVGATGTAGDWKVMHDAAKLEDTWTTMGVGELSGMKRATMTNPTLSTVAAVDPAAERTAPYFLADNDPAWTDGTRADADNYVYTLSNQSQYLRLVDFSDITTELERYKGKDTLVVKAVYEEGTRLLDGSHYTAITEPAFTKWNNVAANAGAAYRAQMTLERSYVQNGQLRGTTRVRMPAIQQDTTVDYKWLNDLSKGVNNDLDNTTYEASLNRTETLYTQVDTDNGEQITFSLALSPRQNKVDYVLVELYTANFVTGTQRSTTNNTFKEENTEKFIPDNYNYLAGEDSDTQDDLYDSDFSTKEGSHGFVLYGTLGHFLEQATKCNNGEIDRDSYNSSVTYSVAMDANLRMDLTGKQPANSSNTILREAFLAAALQCEAHKNDPAYDCWDYNLDAAKLTYHQAQWFLLDYQGNAGADIRTVAAADADKLSFCHYHISCSGGHVPVAPTTWKELVDKLREYNNAAVGSDEKEFAWVDLETMELSALENMTSIRSNANGKKYTNPTTFLKALLAADNKLKAAGQDVNWVNLQYTILNGNVGADGDAMRETAQGQYWWYAGATAAPKINDFTALLTAADAIRNPVTLKDGDNTFYPKSALNAAQYPEQATGYLSAATPTNAQRKAWVALTDNLVPEHAEVDKDPDETPNSGDEYTDFSYGKYPDMAAFLADFNTAYDAILTDIDNGADTPADNNEWWQQLQTKILRAKDPADNLGDNLGDGSNRFWWKSGNTPFKVTNLSTLLECARRLSKPPTDESYAAAYTEWNRITVADIESVAISQGLQWKGSDANHPLYPTPAAQLGASENDQKAAILTQLQAAVPRYDAAAAASGQPLTWEYIQYLLLNPGTGAPALRDVEIQQGYYWWKNGNTTGTTVNISVSNPLDMNMDQLIRATYRADFNDPGVISSIRAAVDATDPVQKTLWPLTRLATQRIQGTSPDHPRADDAVNPNANDTYTGPDVLDDLTPYAYPAGTDDQVRDFLSVMADFRDAAKVAMKIQSDPYGVPSPIYWQQVQYYVFNGTYLDTSESLFMELWEPETAIQGDYWWCYGDVRVPPEPPKEDEPDPPPNPAAALTDLLVQFLFDEVDLYDDVLSVIEVTDLAGEWGITDPSGGDLTMDIWGVEDSLNSLYNNYGWSLDADGLTWAQLTVFMNCAVDWEFNYLETEEEALQWILDSGGDLVSNGGIIHDDYVLIYPELFIDYYPELFPDGLALYSAELSALDIEELTETEAPLATDMQETEPEVTEAETPETAAEPTLDDLLAQKAELERQLAELEKQIAALEKASEKAETPMAKPAVTPARPAAPVEQKPTVAEPEIPTETEPAPEEPEIPAEPETPVEVTPTPAPNHDERMEIPLGEEAVWHAVSVPAVEDAPAVMTAQTVPQFLDALPSELRGKYILLRRVC